MKILLKKQNSEPLQCRLHRFKRLEAKPCTKAPHRKNW
jgi:hypothetical protein